jgi:hypothetical protein
MVRTYSPPYTAHLEKTNTAYLEKTGTNQVLISAAAAAFGLQVCLIFVLFFYIWWF